MGFGRRKYSIDNFCRVENLESMKFVLVNFLIFFSISLYPNSLKTKIKEVRVFSGSAFVTRLGNWNPSGTAGYFYIDELPPSLEKSSISIRFPGKEKIRIKKLHIEKKNSGKLSE